jgi:hypothetical protein
MEFSRITSFFTLLVGVLLLGCHSKSKPAGTIPVYQTEKFRAYWHAGKAEVNAFNLKQSRYGENRPGKAVLIFVTEDLSKKLQVKLDDHTRRNRINVLKLNFTKKFITGIYPYSLMLSVFTPVDRDKEPSSIKASMSSQEWCGQVYTQVNLRGNRYAITSHSYFEQEADQRFSVRQALLEDEIWNFIRLDHESLPVGEIDVVPGLFYSRLNHADIKVRPAIAEKTDTDSAYVYHLTFPEQTRKISIRYAKDFPHKILGWTETWQEMGKTMETTATLDRSLYTDYWTKNKNEFGFLRDSLNLPSPY